MIAAIGRAVEVGINYFDIAAAYCTGEGERIFGERLDAAGITAKRDDIYVVRRSVKRHSKLVNKPRVKADPRSSGSDS